MKKEAENFLNQSSKKEAAKVEAEDKKLETGFSHIIEAEQKFGLDPFATQFELVPPRIMYQMAAYGGLPDRRPHWTSGRDFWQMRTSYEYGLSKIYELIINSDPSLILMADTNPPIENIVTMAHARSGHSDFFKRNYLFKETSRDMPDIASLHARRIRDYEFREGVIPVEKILDAALAIEEHIDPRRLDRPSRDKEITLWRKGWRQKTEKSPTELPMKMPPSPDKDLLGIIRNHAPYLEDWERDTVDIVRTESHYFYPQYRTKIMNEGWASYWHMKILEEMYAKDQITPAEMEHVNIMNAGVLQKNPKGINPYRFGVMMFQYIEEYYNGNLTDKETRWLKNNDYPVYPKYEGKFEDSPGLKKIFEVAENNDDQSLIFNYFNKITADRMNMYIYEEMEFANGSITVIKDKGWMEIRDKMVESKTNCGNPYIVCTDIDYKQNTELYLKHQYEGQELEAPYVEKTLPYIYSLWRKPVHLETVTESGGKTVFTFDGKATKRVQETPPPKPTTKPPGYPYGHP